MMGNGDDVGRERPKHRVALPITHATYTKLVGRWRVMPAVVLDLKAFWAAVHQDLDIEVKDNGDS